MLEAVGDIWTYAGTAVIGITTSGSVTRDGRAVLGRGVACQALERMPEIAGVLGALLSVGGNHVHYLGNDLVSFPVEETAWSCPDVRIIGRSAQELRSLADRTGWNHVVVPRPGCGGGGLAWKDVRPLLLTCFDERFTMISKA